MLARVAVVLALLSALLAGPAGLQAREQRQEPQEPYPDEILVLSQREIAKRVFKDNLEELIAPLSMTDAIPRFFMPLCLDVVGLERDERKFVAERIVRTSLNLGLEQAPPDCRVNSLVVVVDRPEQLFERLVSHRLEMVGILPFRDVHIRRLRDDLRARKPVVWWSVLATANAEGTAFNDIGLVIAPSIQASRTYRALYRPKSLSVVMYDAGQLQGASLGQLADHAALHLLGTPRRGIAFGNVALPSMLSLFENGPATGPQALTDFDKAYLKGLYNLGPGEWQSRVPGAVLAAYAEQCEEQQSECRIRLRN